MKEKKKRSWLTLTMLELPFDRKEARQKKSAHGILSDYSVIIRETELREMLLKPPPLPCCMFVQIARFNVIRPTQISLIV